MPNIIIIPGKDEYEDTNAVSDVLHYCMHSRWTRDFDTRFVSLGENTNLMALQFQMVQNVYNYKNGRKLHHFVLGFGDIYYVEAEIIGHVMELVLDYFKEKGFQIVGVIQRGSNKKAWYQHIHFILNHISIYGDLFYGRKCDYIELARYLGDLSKYKFTCVERYDYNDDYYEWEKECSKRTCFTY
ncbi:hypothetical protein [Blautia producta]|uniref:hypothetical protein n=1 Tax=Blautia producta TaxID=33035 RepID=UPI0031B63475